MPSLIDIRTGRIATHAGHRTAYAKSSRAGPVAVHPLGLEGDAVADTRVHGGPWKAVYAYAVINYALWAADHPQHGERLVPGAFGENLLVDGLDESTVCIGDHMRIGSAILSPCQPRQPCATMARWFGDPHMVKAMVRNGRAGWYLAVIQPGTIRIGDTITLEQRHEDAFSIADVLAASYTASPSAETLRALAGQPGLAPGWAAWARQQAESGKPAPKPL